MPAKVNVTYYNTNFYKPVTRRDERRKGERGEGEGLPIVIDVER
jgi:hypothetical protein